MLNGMASSAQPQLVEGSYGKIAHPGRACLLGPPERAEVVWASDCQGLCLLPQIRKSLLLKMAFR